jgi:hypothetical protein
MVFPARIFSSHSTADDADFAYGFRFHPRYPRLIAFFLIGCSGSRAGSIGGLSDWIDPAKP